VKALPPTKISKDNNIFDNILSQNVEWDISDVTSGGGIINTANTYQGNKGKTSTPMD
jgi:hypothetical protein